MPRSSRYSDADLTAAVAESRSIAAVMRRLGIKPAGGSHFHISKRIKRLGLDTSHFTGQAHNRGKRLERKAPEHFLRRIDPSANRIAAKYLRRALTELGVPYVCGGCELPGEWNGMPLVLHVDHIDGNPWNCERTNLRFLCPNCHAQTPNFCRRKSAAAQA